MATVVRGPDIDLGGTINAILGGINMIQERRLVNEYRDTVSGLLSGREKKIEEGITERQQVPTMINRPVPQQLEQGDFELPAAQYQTTTPMDVNRRLTPEEISQLNIDTRRQVEAAQTGAPRSVQSPDVMKMFPFEKSEWEEKGAGRAISPNTKIFMDHKGRIGVFNYGKLDKGQSHPDFEKIGIQPITNADMMMMILENSLKSKAELFGIGKPEEKGKQEKKSSTSLDKKYGF